MLAALRAGVDVFLEKPMSHDLTEARLRHWDDVRRRIVLPGDPASGLIEQFAGFFSLRDADLAMLRDPGRSRSMQGLLGIEGCAATQNLKQPDVLMLQYLLPERFSPAQVRVNGQNLAVASAVMYGSYVLVEEANGDYVAKHFATNPNGNYYAAAQLDYNTQAADLRYEGPDAVAKIRDILGATDPTKARPGSIRREFGTNIMVNAAHASDSVENARREMRILDVANDPHFETPVSYTHLTLPTIYSV